MKPPTGRFGINEGGEQVGAGRVDPPCTGEMSPNSLTLTV